MEGVIEMKKQLFTFIMATAIFFGPFAVKSMDVHAINYKNLAQGTEAIADPDFDAAYYAHRYPDLLAAGLRTAEQLYQHWITYGKAEGRVGSQTYVVPKALIPTPKVFAPDFDAAYYAHRYPDLMAAGLRTPEQLYQHWITYGKAEGRTGKP